MDPLERFAKPVALLAILVGVLAGQEFRATLHGRVVDTSDAAVPGCRVEVRNTATNELATAVTDRQGYYKVLLLRPGVYSLSVEVPGFKKFTREGVVLGVSHAATVDVKLEPGPVTEQVTVTTGARLLETSTADRAGVLDNRRVRELPLNARNPLMLGLLVAGVRFEGPTIWQRPFDNGSIADWSISGSQERESEFLLDGAPNNAQAGRNNIAYVPPVDAVEEFKIITHTYDAQYGKTGGGIINVSLKSGGNGFHGTGYEFARRSSWDANSFQDNARGAPRSGHFLDQYGVQLEGPLYLPGLYNGKDKTFFLFSYEGYRAGTPSPLNLSVPAPEMLEGDFSNLVDSQRLLITIYDPFSGRDVGGVWRRDPFRGNRIPADRIHPIARRILGYMPRPNTSTPGQGYAVQNLFVSGGDNVARDDFYNLVVKLDQVIGAKHRIFFRHASNDRTETRNSNGIKEGPGQVGEHPLKRINDAYVVDWVGTLQPTLVVNVRSSLGRYVEGDRGDGNQGFDLSSLGFPPSLVSQIPGGAFFGRYEFAGYTSLGRYFNFNYTNTYSFYANLTKVMGRHTLKAGSDLRWTQYAIQNAGTPFFLRAERNFTQREFNRGDSFSGNSIASWLLGSPSTGRIDYNAFPMFLHRYSAPWVQDDWQITRRLTVTLGLRWDFNTPPKERFNRLNRGFDPSSVNPVDRLIDRARFPGVAQLRGGLLFAGVGGQSRLAADLDRSNLQPRVGAAYLWSSRLVLRGGWGRVFLNPGNDYLQINGFSQSTPFIASLDGNRTPILTGLSNPFPSGVLVPPGSSLRLETLLGRDLGFVHPRFQIPYVNQFSFGFQYQLPWQARVEVSYAGSRTKQLETARSFNEIDLALRQQCNLMEGGNPAVCDRQIVNPFQGLGPFRGTGHFNNSTLSGEEFGRPYPHFGRLTELARNDGAIFYNALQVQVEKRGRAGLNLIGAYTWSKQIERWGFNDVQRNVLQQGLSAVDRPHRVSLGSVYQLPFGQGQRWLNTTHGAWSRLLSGWENSVIFQWQSGRPWELPDRVQYLKEARLEQIDWSASKVYGIRPCVGRINDNGSVTMQAYSVLAGCTDFNFLITPRYAPRVTPYRDGRLRLHSVPSIDLSLNKTTRIRETLSVQFRAEAFNLTNTFSFSRENFERDPENSNFGSIIKATSWTGNGFPRHIQLAVKFLW